MAETLVFLAACIMAGALIGYAVGRLLARLWPL
jgi:hypothetical protein